MKKLTGILFLGLLAAAVPARAASVDLHGQSTVAHCSQRALSGHWAFRAEGTGPFGPFAVVGLQTFDRDGGLDAVEMLSAGGVTVPSHLHGTYTVGEDCTGTMRTTFDNGMSGTMYFVVAAGGDQIYALETDPGVMLTVTFTRQ